MENELLDHRGRFSWYSSYIYEEDQVCIEWRLETLLLKKLFWKIPKNLVFLRNFEGMKPEASQSFSSHGRTTSIFWKSFLLLWIKCLESKKSNFLQTNEWVIRSEGNLERKLMFFWRQWLKNRISCIFILHSNFAFSKIFLLSFFTFLARLNNFVMMRSS